MGRILAGVTGSDEAQQAQQRQARNCFDEGCQVLSLKEGFEGKRLRMGEQERVLVNRLQDAMPSHVPSPQAGIASMSYRLQWLKVSL